MLYFKSYTIYSLQESVMIPILISHILRTNLRGLDNLFMDKGKIYTFLNPVSYLMALDRKDLFGQFDGIFADGSILVAAIRLLYGITVKRRSFDMPCIQSFCISYHILQSVWYKWGQRLGYTLHKRTGNICKSTILTRNSC